MVKGRRASQFTLVMYHVSDGISSPLDVLRKLDQARWNHSRYFELPGEPAEWPQDGLTRALEIFPMGIVRVSAAQQQVHIAKFKDRCPHGAGFGWNIVGGTVESVWMGHQQTSDGFVVLRPHDKGLCCVVMGSRSRQLVE